MKAKGLSWRDRHGCSRTDALLLHDFRKQHAGVAIVPRWTSRMAVAGVRYIPLKLAGPELINRLPLAAAWMRGSRDPARDAMLATLQDCVASFAAEA